MRERDVKPMILSTGRYSPQPLSTCMYTTCTYTLSISTNLYVAPHIKFNKYVQSCQGQSIVKSEINYSGRGDRRNRALL